MKKCLYLLLLFLVFKETPLWGDILITEAAVDETNGKDWLELYVVSDNFNINGYKVKVNDSVRNAASTIVTFSTASLPNGVGTTSLQKGTYLIVEIFRSSVSYEKTNNYYVVNATFSTSGTEGIRGTEGVLQLYNPLNELVDVVIFTSEDATSLNSRVVEAYLNVASVYDAKLSTRHWNPSENAIPDNCVRFRGSSAQSGLSFARVMNHSNYLPMDTNTKNDWRKLSRPTKGYGYEKVELPIAVLSVTGENPFSPYHSNILKRKTKFFFNLSNSTGAVKTMRIYDIVGRERAVLINQDVPYYSMETYGRSLKEVPAAEIEWDGRDSNGVILPVGIYIVHIEAYDTSSGQVFSGKATVAIGR